jgi:hypothetical protein
MARVILFRDFNPPRRADGSGYNRLGYLSPARLVVYQGIRRARRAPYEHIRKYRHAILEPKAVFDEAAVEAFFTLNHLPLALLDDGLLALRDAKTGFFDYAVRLPILAAITAEERAVRWRKLVAILAPGDVVATFDSTSRLSRVIALVDGGPWSHTGLYVGDGRIAEALTRGVIERGIESYQSERYRLGVYRPLGLTAEGAARIIAVARSGLGAAYNYMGVARVGLRLLFDTAAGAERFPSVTELALASGLRLIHVV